MEQSTKSSAPLRTGSDRVGGVWPHPPSGRHWDDDASYQFLMIWKAAKRGDPMATEATWLWLMHAAAAMVENPTTAWRSHRVGMSTSDAASMIVTGWPGSRGGTKGLFEHIMDADFPTAIPGRIRCSVFQLARNMLQKMLRDFSHKWQVSHLADEVSENQDEDSLTCLSLS